MNLPYTIAEDYKNSEVFRQEKAQKEGRIYQPGIFTTLPEVLVDSNEKNFTKIIYQDENGKKIEIPIEEITPEIAAQNQGAFFYQITN
ncbi:hypothetical protein [Desulfosporosinus sp. I2]|uniref:hypothetical protein n=1 Tax=Desulfosporosinus sp. I2 TaxID=1617025 RepID=UPI0012E0B165|nr:hypothetical protein [Desulfosporosinus sp. I2]